MQKHPKRGWIAAAILIGTAACSSTPYTHRSQFIVVPESYEVSLGADAYKETLNKATVVRDPHVVALVTEVGQRIAQAANKPSYHWEFTVIDDDRQVNAFALPGGKVAVYTGLFPVARDTAGLAAVIGHEVGHALARHGAERMSQNLALQTAGTGLQIALGSSGGLAQEGIMQAFGLGAKYGVLLPFSRSQEAEADHIGLILMAKAGYDPHAALELWQRFEQSNKSSPPEFLSTHPSYGARQHNIAAWLPEAMSYYTPNAAVKVVGLPTPETTAEAR